MSTIPFARPFLAPTRIADDLNGSSKFGSAVQGSLARQGYPADQAASYSLVYQSAYAYVQDNWVKIIQGSYKIADGAKTTLDTYQGAKTWMQASTLLQNAVPMGASDAILTGFSDARLVGGAGVLSGLVQVMQVVAAKNNVELNPCAMSIAKVSLDLAGIAGGGLTAETGFGAVLALMSAASAVSDVVELGSSCGVRN